MLGELFFGIYFNLSLWYKLIDQTRMGRLFLHDRMCGHGLYHLAVRSLAGLYGLCVGIVLFVIY